MARRKKASKKTAKKKTVKRASKRASPMAHLAKKVNSQEVRIGNIEAKMMKKVKVKKYDPFEVSEVY